MHQALTGDPTAFPTDQRLSLSLCHSPTFSHKSQGLALSYNLAQLCRAHSVYTVYLCMHICVYIRRMHSFAYTVGAAHTWVNLSLWESSFVTKQSHPDSSGKRHCHMLSHRLQPTKSPSGSAGHVSHMSACGCLGFSALYTCANTHTPTLTQSVAPAHVYTCVIYTHHPTVHIAHLRTSHTLHSLESCYLVVWLSAFSTLFPVRQKPYAKAQFSSWRAALCLKHRDLLFYV